MVVVVRFEHYRQQQEEFRKDASISMPYRPANNAQLLHSRATHSNGSNRSGEGLEKSGGRLKKITWSSTTATAASTRCMAPRFYYYYYVHTNKWAAALSSILLDAAAAAGICAKRWGECLELECSDSYNGVVVTVLPIQLLPSSLGMISAALWRCR